MRLPRFTLHRPATVAEAAGLLASFGDEGAAYAGGTELLLAMKHRVLRYSHLVDLKHVAGLGGVRLERDEPGARLVIGALATHRELERHPLVCAHLPAYAALSAGVANVRVRAAGTLGGNLCFAEPHADPPALLAALGARVVLAGEGGTREEPVERFVAGAFETTCRPGEVLTAVVIPLSPGSRVAYERFGHLERPSVTVAVVLETDAAAPRVARARVHVGAVAGRPAAAPGAEALLSGVPLGEVAALARGAGERAGGEATVDADLHGAEDYKRHLVGVLVERALRRAAA